MRAVLRKAFLSILVFTVVVSASLLAMGERFEGMGMRPASWLVPDIDDLYYVTTMSQGGLAAGYCYTNGNHLGFAGLNLGFVNLVGGISKDASGTLYIAGAGLAWGRLGVGISIASSSFEAGNVAVDGGIASKELFLLTKITFPHVALKTDMISDEIKSRLDAEEYRLDAVARLHLGEALLLSASYSDDKPKGETSLAALVGLTLAINHAYEKPVSKYYSKTEYQKLPTMIAGVYERTESLDTARERVGIVAEGIVRPAIVLRAGIFAVKEEEGYDHYETFFGAGLIFSNLRVDVNLTGFSGFETLALEITLDGRKF